METTVVRRRMNTLSGHFAAEILTEDVTPPNTHLIPLNCSSSLSTTFKRLDNRLIFGRQASASQGKFMRQAANTVEQEQEQNCNSNLSTASFKRLDNRLLFGRQASASQGKFMRQATNTMEQGNLQDARPRACSAKCKTTPPEPVPPSFSRPGSTGPLFARPSKNELNFYNNTAAQSFTHQDDKVLPAASDRSSSATLQEKQALTCTRPMASSPINGWSPRINVIESKSKYVITVELPGVEINDIRVEMDDKNLIVRGKRSMKWWKTAGGLNDSFTTYHRREISQGPYQVVWPLPPRTNKESCSAELVEGILHVTIPKL